MNDDATPALISGQDPVDAPQEPVLFWTAGKDKDDDGAGRRSARWCSVDQTPPPAHCIQVDDRLGADEAYRMAVHGTAMLWSGDYRNARQLLSALARRIPVAGTRAGTSNRSGVGPRNGTAMGTGTASGTGTGSGTTRTVSGTGTGSGSEAATAADFYRYRQSQAHRSRILGMVLVPLDAGPAIALPRAPDIAGAWLNAYGTVPGPSVAPLQEVLGAIGAEQWRTKGLFIPALQARIHPHYGTFAPVRGEYLDLVDSAPLPATDTAFDVGTGTGVLAAILAHRGIRRVIATDSQPRAIACARENFHRLGLQDSAEAIEQDMFPQGRAGLIVCNPPWLPGAARTMLDHAVYDQKSRMLRAFLNGLADHLEPGGEGWLVISDLAERLGLRTRGQLLDWIAGAGLQVRDKADTVPVHSRAADATDPFHAARSGEVTSLWRLVVA